MPRDTSQVGAASAMSRRGAAAYKICYAWDRSRLPAPWGLMLPDRSMSLPT